MGTTTLRAQLLDRFGQAPEWAVDAVLGTLIVLIGLATATGDVAGYHPHDGAGVALVLAVTVPFYLRRQAPLAVFAVSAGVLSVLMLLDYDEGALPWTLLLGAYTVAAYRPTRHQVAAGVVMAASLVALLVGSPPQFGAGDAATGAIGFAAALLLGHSMQARRRRIDAFAGEQAEAELRAASYERLRIAQELHDVVAHSLGVIAVQAGVGMHVIDSDPAEAKRSLEHISRTSRSSLAEIRRLLGMVRNLEGMPAYTPAPGLTDLDRLVAEVTAAGLPVEVAVEGELDDLPVGLGLAAYRIIQEALTNALRHAGAHTATVRLTQRAGALDIEVSDDGRGPNGAAPSGGHGLVGMRERVALFGGTLTTGPAPGGGFRVTAKLPYDTEPVA